MRFTSYLSYLIGFSLIYLSVYIAEGSHFNILVFWDLSSALVILAGILITFINFHFSEVFNAFKDSILSQKNEGFIERSEISKMVIKSMSNYIMYFSIFSFAISMIMSLGNMETTQQLGNSIAVSLLVLVYAVIAKFVILSPMCISIEKKLLDSNK